MLLYLILCIAINKVLSDEAPVDGCLLDIAAPKAAMVTDLGSFFRSPVSASDRRIYYKKGDMLFITCPGGSFNFPSLPGGIPLRCQGGTSLSTISPADQYFDFTEITCSLSQRPSLTSKYFTNSCENGGTSVQAGYTVNDNFAHVLTVCFDTSKLIPSYASYALSAWADELANYTGCSYVFSTYQFPNMNPFNIYDYTTAELESLGVVGYANKNVFLVKGQLATSDDFLSPFQRDAAFLLTNVAPQWNTFIEGNWASLGKSIRKYARTENLGEVSTYVGTLGVATLPNSNNTSVELYLSQGKIPVPKWFWKLIYSRSAGTGYIFFGYNNPFETKEQADVEFAAICTQNVLNNIDWINDVDNDRAASGFLYACPFDVTQITETVIQGIIAGFSKV